MYKFYRDDVNELDEEFDTWEEVNDYLNRMVEWLSEEGGFSYHGYTVYAEDYYGNDFFLFSVRKNGEIVFEE
jgi:hypothetical protein